AAALASVALVVGGTAAWAAAFESIYAQPHSRVAASEWIFAHVPAGATITSEYWDDALPLPLANHPAPTTLYHEISLDLYADRDNQEAFDYVADALGRADYIILASDRLARSIPRSPWRYPVVAEYYRLLASGQLGYQLVYESDQLPRLGPLTIDDRDADESFTVYDHPHVRIYKRVQTLSRAELEARFAWALGRPWSPTRYPTEQSLLLERPVDTMPAAEDVGWSAGLTRRALPATIVWLAAVTALGLLAAPLVGVFFGGFADLGWGLARLAGLLVFGYGVWIAVSLGLVQFTVGWILAVTAGLASLVGLTAGGGGAGWRSARRQRGALIVASEAVFLAAFAF
ncbi:MAG: hypothetical protein IRY97_12370, partial [Thermomicrobiaceae bacterium]|nr:hypothetical protein [Thermomicrobiaceae bacterium]